MTAPTAAPVAGRRHLLVALRLAVVGSRVHVLTEVGVIAALLVFTIAMAALQGPNDDGSGNIVVLLVVYTSAFTAYLQTITQTLPFALSLGVTRRHFAGAVGLMVLTEAVLTGVALTLLLGVERLTDGWGYGLRLVDFSLLSQSGPISQFLVFTVPFLAFAAAGLLMATVFKRWGTVGVWSAVIGTGALIAGFALLVTGLRAWPLVDGAVASSSSLALVAGYPALLAVVLAVAAFGVVRRATP